MWCFDCVEPFQYSEEDYKNKKHHVHSKCGGHRTAAIASAFSYVDREFEWTDDLVIDFARFTNNESLTFQGRYSDLLQFKRVHSAEPSAQPAETELKNWEDIKATWLNLRSELVDVANILERMSKVSAEENESTFCKKLVANLRALNIFNVIEEGDNDTGGKYVDVTIENTTLSFSFDDTGEKLTRIGMYKDRVEVTGQDRIWGN